MIYLLGVCSSFTSPDRPAYASDGAGRTGLPVRYHLQLIWSSGKSSSSVVILVIYDTSCIFCLALSP